MQRPLRIALLTHSTNPRGGVVHALELGSALHDAGHEATVFAPGNSGGFFRAARCATVCIPARRAGPELIATVRQRIRDYIDYFSRRRAGWDVMHAQDAISANALSVMQARGELGGFVRTVHHLDAFAQPQLMAWQTNGFIAASRIICVSALWRDLLDVRYGLQAEVIPNGVDRERYSEVEDASDARVRFRYGLGLDGGPVLLAVGGIEARKNTLRLLAAFLQVRRALPRAQLVVAGGASLLRHDEFRRHFDELLRASGLQAGCGRSVVLAGVAPDDDMPALFRCADVLVFPSLREGFGLVVLESMASGTPVVVSKRPPFTEYLAEGDCAWCDPLDVESIASAIREACDPRIARVLRDAGRAVSARYSWRVTAQRHLEVYASWLQHPCGARSAEQSHA